MKIIFGFKTNSLPREHINLFQKNKEVNGHFTRNVSKEDIFIPQIKTN